MRLHEEYIIRHDLPVSVVRYDKRSTVFLKSKDSPHQWRILSLHWKECDWHPGHFDARYTRPCHNGNEDVLLEDVFTPRQLHWDEYEEYLLKLVEEIREEYTAVAFEDQHFASWQVFLVMYDSSLSLLGRDFISIVGKSLSPNISLSQRDQLVEAGKRSLKRRAGHVYEALEHQVMPLTSDYAEWLVKLVNEE